MIRSLYRSAVPVRWRNQINYWRYNSRGRKSSLRYSMTDPQFRNKCERLASLQNAYRGNRCFIMGNGPSLNKMDLEVFAGEYVWASNRAHLLFDRVSWRPRFWVSVDRRVVPDNAYELLTLQEQLTDTLFFLPDVFLLTGVLQSRPNTYWFYERRDEQRFPEGFFSVEVPRYVASARTVTITAIQLAVHLGFNPIYLFGCDTRYQIPSSTITEKGDAELLLSLENDDPNHFDGRYFGAGHHWHNPHPELMIEHYGQVKKVTDNLGVKVFNATLGGDLEVFERVDYKQLVSPE